MEDFGYLSDIRPFQCHLVGILLGCSEVGLGWSWMLLVEERGG